VLRLMLHSCAVPLQIEKEVKAFGRSSGRAARSCIVVGGVAMQAGGRWWAGYVADMAVWLHQHSMQPLCVRLLQSPLSLEVLFHLHVAILACRSKGMISAQAWRL
jgi:hypothetical protein